MAPMTQERPMFTSARERRLWLLALAVVVAIYSTLGLARTLADELRNRELLDTVFFLGFLVMIATVVIVGLKTRLPNAAEVAVLLGVAVVYLLVFLRMAIPEERTHLIEYSVLALLIHEALSERRSRGRHVPVPAPLAIAVVTLLGTLDEVIQVILPGRVFDPIDIGFNVLAAVMAVTASVALSWVARRRHKR